MANVKISQLTAASSVSSSANVPIVQSGDTFRATVSQIAQAFQGAGYARKIALGDISLTGKL